MAALSSVLALDKLGKYREPVIYFGGGLLGGLLVFVVWLALQPAADKAALATQAEAAAAAAKQPRAGDDGVLGGITGGPTPGQARSIEPTPEPSADADGSADPNAIAGDQASATAANGEVSAATSASDEQALADGLLSSAPAAPTLQTFYVEVARGPGVTEILEINAESAERALSIIRDYRGNPKVTRGPSTRPLD